MKIALLCSNKMAMPAMARMAKEGVLCGLATADRDAEVVALFRQQAAAAKAPYCCVSRSNYVTALEQWIQDTGADAVFVMTFPWRLPAALLAVPRLGFVNFHYGLLPQMRGADPVFESIRQRKPTAGVTVHVMNEGLDTGAILLREEMPLPPEYTYGMLSSQLAMMAERMCGQLLQAGSADAGSGWNGWPLQQQDEANARYWPRVGEAEMTINWRGMDCAEIMALVRSCNPIAKGVPTTINGWKIGVCDVGEVNLQGDASAIQPGTIVALDMQNGMIVYCRDGKGLKLDVVYTAEGVMPGYKLAFFGIGMGMMFG